MQDLTNNNRSSNKSKSNNGHATADLTTTANSSNQPFPKKDGPRESTTLRDFRDTIKDVLEEITWLEVNTMIVSNIALTKFDPQDFYNNLIENTMYKTEEGLRDIKKSLLERSTDLKQKGALLSQTELDRHNRDLESYNRDLEIYKRAERTFSDRQSSLDPRQKEQFEMEKDCYEEVSRKVLQLHIPKNPDGSLIVDAQTTRLLRKLWELEQSVLNGERICAQTKLSLDGDLTNRFIEDLFVSNRGKKIDPTIAKLVFDLHNHAAESAEKQWSGLITTCVNLVKDLIPFRNK
jgi:hypothetical protein